ncbi:MAG: hypothetical protein WD875_10255 [Pirellulales bacterium]
MRRLAWYAVSPMAAVLLGTAAWMTVWACGGYGSARLTARELAAADNGESAALVGELRALGPEGLEAILAIRDAAAVEEGPLASQSPIGPPPKPSERMTRLDALVDRVAAQRGASMSRLYWYTDLDAALAAAKTSGRPVLSLRMLGNLTDECSCANSRFFRTTLYANAELSKHLRENFVLHWRSVRPVPKVTIDFGDGRKLVRTVTGNSIHYVLDAEGRLIDGLPGLYGPRAFRRWLDEASTIAKAADSLPVEQRADYLVAYHKQRADAIRHEWTSDLKMVAPEVAEALMREETGRVDAAERENAKAPAATKAAPLSPTKSAVELVVVREIAASSEGLERATGDDVWTKIAALHAEDAKLDAASVEIIRRENPPTAEEAGRRAFGKYQVEDPIVRMVRNFESSIAVDTVKNEYLLHRQLHQWLAEAAGDVDVETLNERVYAQLFLTPSSDPWLGLAPADTYTALENGGAAAENRRSDKQ